MLQDRAMEIPQEIVAVETARSVGDKRADAALAIFPADSKLRAGADFPEALVLGQLFRFIEQAE